MDVDKLMNWPHQDIVQTYTERDSIIYALGVGLGVDPLDKRQLKYVYEGARMEALPSLATILCHPGMWTSHPDTGIVRAKQVHGEQGLVIHRPLKTSGRIRGRTRVTGIIDKGAGRGGLLYSERDLYDDETKELVATLSSTTFCRGNGGFGGPTGPLKPVHAIPERPADATVEWPTVPQAALFYRLSGDLNPLHADPDFAAAVGFERPILHGLATYGLAVWAVMLAYADAKGDAIKAARARFSAPLVPGESVRFELWRDGMEVSVRGWGMTSGKKVLDNGIVVLR